MQAVLAFAALIAIDPVELFRVPCIMVNGLPYYQKLQLLVGAPILASILLSILTFFGHMCQAHHHHRKSMVRKKAAAAMQRMKAAGVVPETQAEKRHRREQARAKAASGAATGDADGDPDALDAEFIAELYRKNMKQSVQHGLQRSVALVCLLLDELYPSVTRAILQIFRCRELGASGYWLEADYGASNVQEHFCQPRWPGFSFLLNALCGFMFYGRH